MIKSEIYSDIVVHKLRGDVTPRDCIDAKTFVKEAVENLPPDFCVLWDFREAHLMRADDSYSSVASALVDGSINRNHCKRAFLVASEDHKRRLGKTLATAKAPWPWSIFSSFTSAVAWIREVA